jgi:hypothetical protein
MGSQFFANSRVIKKGFGFMNNVATIPDGQTRVSNLAKYGM